MISWPASLGPSAGQHITVGDGGKEAAHLTVSRKQKERGQVCSSVLKYIPQ
jgi:hypothetical protein